LRSRLLASTFVLTILVLTHPALAWATDSFTLEANPTSATVPQGATPVHTDSFSSNIVPISNIDQFLETCPPTDELQRLMADFPIYTYGENATQRVYHCSEPVSSMPIEELSQTFIEYQALRVILHMIIDQPLPWTNLQPYDWLRSKIGGISIRDDTEYAYCCDQIQGRIVIVLPTMPFDLLTYYRQFINLQQSIGLYGEIPLILHEARHVDLPHDCGYKDSSLAYMGAYAITYYTDTMLAENHIQIGIRNSPNAGAYIIRLVYMTKGLADPTISPFCNPPTSTSLSLDFGPSSYSIGSCAPVTITVALTPPGSSRSVLLFYNKFYSDLWFCYGSCQ
jgi:hypothetical protein